MLHAYCIPNHCENKGSFVNVCTYILLCTQHKSIALGNGILSIFFFLNCPPHHITTRSVINWIRTKQNAARVDVSNVLIPMYAYLKLPKRRLKLNNKIWRVRCSECVWIIQYEKYSLPVSVSLECNPKRMNKISNSEYLKYTYTQCSICELNSKYKIQITISITSKIQLLHNVKKCFPNLFFFFTRKAELFYTDYNLT